MPTYDMMMCMKNCDIKNMNMYVSDTDGQPQPLPSIVQVRPPNSPLFDNVIPARSDGTNPRVVAVTPSQSNDGESTWNLISTADGTLFQYFNPSGFNHLYYWYMDQDNIIRLTPNRSQATAFNQETTSSNLVRLRYGMNMYVTMGPNIGTQGYSFLVSSQMAQALMFKVT